MAAEILASAEDSRLLFERMGQLRTMAPWGWMEETDLFGVQDPETGEIGFVSIMGMAGEHYAVAVYQGARGLYGFWHLQESGPFLEPQDVFNTPQLQASLEDREMLELADRNLIKALGLKYRGRHAWPMFRSYRPGYAPWYIEPAEARFLAHVLGQVLLVAPRVQQNPSILEPGGDTDYLVRVAQQRDDDLVWRDEMRSIAPPPLIGLDPRDRPRISRYFETIAEGKLQDRGGFLPVSRDGRGERRAPLFSLHPDDAGRYPRYHSRHGTAVADPLARANVGTGQPNRAADARESRRAAHRNPRPRRFALRHAGAVCQGVPFQGEASPATSAARPRTS